MKRIKFLIISLASFLVGGYLLAVSFSIMVNQEIFTFTPRAKNEVRSRQNAGEDLLIFLISLGAGSGGIIHGVWYLMNLKNTDNFD